MTITVDNYEELTDVVGWVYLTNKWSIGQTRIIISRLGEVSYTQLISGKVHLKYPTTIDIAIGHVRLFYSLNVPTPAELSYDDWEDLFN